jgi:aminoglycoside phosphotransferase family enzyme
MADRQWLEPNVTVDRPAVPDLANIDIDRKVAFLGSVAAYAEQPSRVERVETHFSWVFLTDRHVYKLKKPLRGEGFDFSTGAARRRNAETEVRLNRRLAGEVYVGTVPLTLQREGGLAITGTGVAIDWLVKMIRLPAQRMLDRRLARGNLSRAEINVLADRLAHFFATARRAHIQPTTYLDRFRAECCDARRALRVSGGPGLRHIAGYVVRQLEAFIDCRKDLLLRRLENGRVVEGHGDLRPEHICLGSTPVVIDCLEFRADLRLLDPVSELAFLAMESERMGAGTVGNILLCHYRSRAGDSPPALLINFYKAIGALIRARIAILHLQERPVREPAKWPKRAAAYLGFACREARHLGP